MESTGEGAVNTVEVTTKDLEYYINLIDKATAEFESTDSNSSFYPLVERSSTVGKMLSDGIMCYSEIICERKSQLMWQTPLLSYLKELSQLPHNSSYHLDQSAAINMEEGPPPAKRLCLTEGSDDG